MPIALKNISRKLCFTDYNYTNYIVKEWFIPKGK